MTFVEKLHAAIEKSNSLLCVGLDADITKIPQHLLEEQYSLFSFNKAIIEATAQYVSSFKLNSAFYEGLGAEGIMELHMTCMYLQKHYPEIPLILDAKRADIGNTNNGYVRFAFEYLQVDAITVHPYLGKEALTPFLEHKEKGIIVLCRTSNPGATEIQDLLVDKEPLYIRIAKKVVNEWNKNGNCLMVVGATYPEELKKIRDLAPQMFFLVPGIGVQGGDLEQTLINGLTKEKSGLIIHSARGILYASHALDFAQKAAEEAKKLRDEINQYRT